MTGHSPASFAGGPAISRAALVMGLPDPMAMAQELLAVDVDALREWFGLAARTQVRLWQGAARLADVLPVLIGGWSSAAPRLAVGRQADAALASRRVIAIAIDASDQAGAVLAQSRVLTDAELSVTQAALLALGWPPAEELTTWAMWNSQLGPVTAILHRLADRLGELGARNTEALRTLALALRADPRDAVQELLRRIGPPTPASPGAAAPGSAVGGGGVDSGNLARLAADLRSTDFARLSMALGVSAALDKARAESGVAQLLTYESAGSGGQGRAAISVGDITSADNVATVTPGIGNAPVNMADGITSAAALRREALRQAPADSTAVVAWYGYDVPLSVIRGVPVGPLAGIANAASPFNDQNARAGGALLVNDIEQFRQWAPSTARFVAVGFSMGSTVVSAAAARGAAIDDLVMLGSPGAGGDVRTADDYPNLPAEHAFAVSFEQDPITLGSTDALAGIVGGIGHLPLGPGPFGPDPASEDFGAQVIDADSNVPDVDVSLPVGPGPIGGLLGSAVANQLVDLAAHHQEPNYFAGGSLSAIAAVLVGRYSDVPIKPGR